MVCVCSIGFVVSLSLSVESAKDSASASKILSGVIISLLSVTMLMKSSYTSIS